MENKGLGQGRRGTSVQCSGKSKEAKIVALNRREHVKHIAQEKTFHVFVNICELIMKCIFLMPHNKTQEI